MANFAWLVDDTPIIYMSHLLNHCKDHSTQCWFSEIRQSILLLAGKWSSPPTTGPRPPPCSHFSFTAINNHQAVLFGGNQQGRRVNDCFLIDFDSMVCPKRYYMHAMVWYYCVQHTECMGEAELSKCKVGITQWIIAITKTCHVTMLLCILCHLSQEWTSLERPRGAPWPVSRDSHAACCLNYGKENPQLLITGGVDKDGNTLQDAWVLDVKSGEWREVRMYQQFTCLSLQYACRPLTVEDP